MDLTLKEARLMITALRFHRCIIETGNPHLMATNVPEPITSDFKAQYACYPTIKPLSADEMRIILSLVDMTTRLEEYCKNRKE